jgi:hypothetical protein
MEEITQVTFSLLSFEHIIFLLLWSFAREAKVGRRSRIKLHLLKQDTVTRKGYSVFKNSTSVIAILVYFTPTPLLCGSKVNAYLLFCYNSNSLDKVVHRTKLSRLFRWGFTATIIVIDCKYFLERLKTSGLIGSYILLKKMSPCLLSFFRV